MTELREAMSGFIGQELPVPLMMAATRALGSLVAGWTAVGSPTDEATLRQLYGYAMGPDGATDEDLATQVAQGWARVLGSLADNYSRDTVRACIELLRGRFPANVPGEWQQGWLAAADALQDHTAMLVARHA